MKMSFNRDILRDCKRLQRHGACHVQDSRPEAAPKIAPEITPKVRSS